MRRFPSGRTRPDRKSISIRWRACTATPFRTCACFGRASSRRNGARSRIARFGDLFMLADPGWEFVTTVPRALYTLGEHGYDPETPEMMGIFLAVGPSFRSGVRLGAARESNAPRAADSPAATSESDPGDDARLRLALSSGTGHRETPSGQHVRSGMTRTTETYVRDRRPSSRKSQVLRRPTHSARGAHVSDRRDLHRRGEQSRSVLGGAGERA